MPDDDQTFAIPQAPEHTFDTIVGQDLGKRFLERAVALGRLPQALLFVGPEGVGKRSLMYALAKRLATLAFAPDSDEARRAEGKIERGTHPDVLMVEASSGSGQILTKQVDAMQERAYYAPLESTRKVIMVSPIEAMNTVAANHLLKLLEEPPASLVFLLSSCQMHRVLPTIRSRCAVLRCPPVETEAIAQWLTERLRCPESLAVGAARLSGGRPGVAYDLVTGQDQERRRRLTQTLGVFQKQGYPSVFRVANRLLADTGHVEDAMAFLQAWFRDLLVGAITNRADQGETPRPDGDLTINTDLDEELAQALEGATPEGLAGALEQVLRFQKRFGRRPYIDGDLVLEVLLTEMGIAMKG